MNFRDNGAIAAFERGDLEQARTLTEQQLAAEPHAPALLHLMGLILCRAGEIQGGADWLQRASDARPDNVAYRVMLARALIDCGRFQEALDVAEPPSGSTAADFALWHARAEAADALERWPEAAEAWAKACTVRAGDWLAWSNFGKALGEIGLWREAVPTLERAVALNPGALKLRRNLAGALNNAGLFEECAEQFRRCIEAAPRDKFLRISLVPVLDHLGREEESQAELHKAAELSGETFRDDGVGLLRVVTDHRGEVDVAALRELADLLERTNRLDALDKLLEDALEKGIAPEQIGYSAAAAALRRGDPGEAKRLLLAENPDPSPLRWHWLMARIEDSLGNSAAAFAEAGAMNRSSPDYDRWRREGAEQRRALRRLADAVTPSWRAGLPRLEPGERADPVFVVGFPRSGTTLLDTFLRGHPETVVVEELPLVRAAELAIGDMAELPQRSAAELAHARDVYFAELERHAIRPGGALLIDKLPLNMLAAPLVQSLFPNARMIFAQRHPCDAVLSCFMQAFVLNNSMASFLDVEDAADFYDAALTMWTRSCETFSINAHTVVYEKLIVDPEATLRPVIDFLGLEWRSELLDHRATAKARGRIITPSYNQVTQPLSTAPAGRWRRHEKELAPVLDLLLPWAERLGYGT